LVQKLYVLNKSGENNRISKSGVRVFLEGALSK